MKRCTTLNCRLVKMLSCLIIGNCFCPHDVSVAAMLDTHTVVLDGQGEIIPWTSDPGAGYDRVMFLSWDLLLNRIHTDPNNGLPAYYTHSEYDPNGLTGEDWPNNAAGKHAMLADSASRYYYYSGNTGVVALVTGLLELSPSARYDTDELLLGRGSLFHGGERIDQLWQRQLLGRGRRIGARQDW